MVNGSRRNVYLLNRSVIQSQLNILGHGLLHFTEAPLEILSLFVEVTEIDFNLIDSSMSATLSPSGSLISSTYTMTAAHCVQDKGRQEPMQSQNALLFIGKHNLIQWNEEGFEKKGVKSFKVHPEWNVNDAKYDADIALIEMESAVSYSKFIRPICLWNGPSELAQVVGQTGIVAGWGEQITNSDD